MTAPPPGTPTSREAGRLNARMTSGVTSVTGKDSTPNAALISSAVAGSPTVTILAMSPCSASGIPRTRGKPAGPVTRSSTTSRKSAPVTFSMIADSTQCADVAWYSYDVPGSQLSRHRAKASRRPVGVAHCGGPRGAWGKPAVCSMTCSTVMPSLPLVPNSCTYSTTRFDTSTRPSPISAHMAPATNAFVHEKTA
jgi:hypothetical protein